jgi:hypothetical protein
VAVVVAPPSAPVFRSPEAAHGLLVRREGTKLDVSPSRAPARVTIYVSLPRDKGDRSPIAVTGPGYRGLLTSAATRLPGLVALTDVAPSVRALRQGEQPRIRSEPARDPLARLAELDRRLEDAKAARVPASAVLVLLVIALAAAALVTRSPRLARAAVLGAPSVLVTALVPSAAGWSSPWLVVPLLGAGGAALALAGSVFRPGLPLALAFAFLFVTMWAAPDWNSLAAIGPHPETGGRFYGLPNEGETLLLGPALVLGALAGPRALPAVALVLAACVGAGHMGADGGGLIVYLAGFLALALRLHRVPAARAAAATAVAAAGALAFVAIDAATGGSSHVTDALGGGPGELVHDFTRRLRLSGEALAETWYATLLTAVGLVALVWLGLRRPRFALFDAYLAALAVSLLVNDTPNDVCGYGAVGGLALWTYVRSGEARSGLE